MQICSSDFSVQGTQDIEGEPCEKWWNRDGARTCLKVTEVVVLSLVLLHIIGLFTIPTIYYVLPSEVSKKNYRIISDSEIPLNTEHSSFIPGESECVFEGYQILCMTYQIYCYKLF